jgi:hypothetical protein
MTSRVLLVTWVNIGLSNLSREEKLDFIALIGT